MNVLEISKQINKAWKNETITPGDMIPECARFSMGTLSADFALYGGLPEGKLVVYAGESGSCKSLLACLAMAQYQKTHPDKTCIYVDAEETLIGQVEWFSKMTGLIVNDPNKFVRYDCCGKSAEEIFDDIVELQKADNIGMIIIDSAPMLLSQADIDNKIAKDNGQRAAIAKSMGKFLKFMVPAIARAKNTLLIINHTRIAGTTFTGAKIYTEPCGYALNFYPCIKVRFANRKFTQGDKLDIAASQTGAETDGLCATFSVTKNRLGSLNRNGAKIVFRFDTGLDTLTDLIEIITKYEIAQRPTVQSWILVNPITGEVYVDDAGNELKFVGKQKMVDYIRNNPEFRAMYEKDVSDYINHSKRDVSLIDEEDLAMIMEMEKSVEGIKEDEDEDARITSIKDAAEIANANAEQLDENSDITEDSQPEVDQTKSDEDNIKQLVTLVEPTVENDTDEVLVETQSANISNDDAESE